MDEIRQVFEGSCDLIPLKVVAKECRKLADDFIPEMIEALTSQMNPQVVCSTAGLCNNLAIDKLLEGNERVQESIPFTCENCKSIFNIIAYKFHISSHDKILDGFLSFCGTLSSFSDACASLILTNFNEIYGDLSKNMKADKICHLSGVCSSKFHRHHKTSIAQIKKVEINSKPNLGFVNKDDIPCQLCEQLVKHLRDVLVANTTESEFKTVLEGLCNQTKGFAEECVSIVDHYYPVIYESLVNNIDANGACFLMGVCPKENGRSLAVVHMPLLPSENIYVQPKKRLEEIKKVYSNDNIKTMILPIDQLMGPIILNQSIQGEQFCTTCQYFLHFLQEEFSNPKTEDEIKEIVGKTCEKFPSSIRSNCHEFINLYGDAVIAMLIQEIDPRDLCPILKLCPKQTHDVFAYKPINVEINEEDGTSNPKCPLCVLIVKNAQDFIESPKSKKAVKIALKKACSTLPPKLHLQCTDFVDTYYDELLEKLVGNFRPNEICEDLKLCVKYGDINEIPDFNDNGHHAYELKNFEVPSSEVFEIDEALNVNTVAIPAQNLHARISLSTMEQPKSINDDPTCVLCEFVMTKLEQELKDKKTQEEIKNTVLNICSKMPNSISKSCSKFVNQYAELIITLIDTVPPKQICTQMSLCVALRESAKLVGTSECTYGPNHFCSDIQIAIKCKVCIAYFNKHIKFIIISNYLFLGH